MNINENCLTAYAKDLIFPFLLLELPAFLDIQMNPKLLIVSYMIVVGNKN